MTRNGSAPRQLAIRRTAAQVATFPVAMMDSQAVGRVFIVLGPALSPTGVVPYPGRGIPLLGRLPGHLRVDRPGFSL